MYYQTKLKSVGNGGAIDVQGKRLSFISNLPVQAGDTVWTDGKVIFGHVSIQDTPLIPIAANSGIPVLDEDTLCGYIKMNGNYKEYDIEQDDWIVNTDKTYKHGIEEYNGVKVIDAEINDDDGNEDLYTVTEGFYFKNQAKIYKNPLHTGKYTYTSEYPPGSAVVGKMPPFNVLGKFIPHDGEELTLGAGVTDTDITISYEGEKVTVVSENEKNDSVIFYKNEQPFKVANLKPYAELAAQKAIEIKNKIMEKSNKNENAINYMKLPEPPKDFVASLYARISALNIKKNGDWDAIISTSAYGYCFPYLTYDVSIFPASFPNFEDKVFSEALEECMRNFDIIVFTENSYPELNIEKYPDFVGTKKDENGNWTAAYKQYVLDKVEYYLPLAKFKYYYWYPQMFCSFLILKVHNGEIEDTIQSAIGGGSAISANTISWNERITTTNASYAFIIKSEQNKKKYNFPIDDQYYFMADGLKIEEIYRSEKNEKIVNVSENTNLELHDNYYEANFILPLQTYTTVDNIAQSLADNLNHSLAAIWGRSIHKIRLHYKFISPVNEEEIYDKYPKKGEYSYLNAWFQKGDDEDTDLNHALNFNHCFCELRGGAYLIGIHGGKLLKVDSNGNIEIIADKLKNFRLRKLKNMAKAKK